MNDRAVSLLEQYDVEILRTRKGRGAIICDTDRGCLIYKEYSGNENRIATQNALLTHIGRQGKVNVEEILPTREGALFVKDSEGTQYVLKTYCEGRECDISEREECLEAVLLLAKLHESTEGFGVNSPASLSKEYEKRNRELKKVRKFLKQRSQKTLFEIQLLHNFDFFLEQALGVAEEWGYYEKEVLGASDVSLQGFCHGDYQYHNILKTERGWFLINFEKCVADDPIRDLYLFMRKLLEKSNWSVSLGKEILNTYEKERPIPAISRIDLYYRLAYPEKFWKIVNFYYNSGKAWIPERNGEKLTRLIDQETEKQAFLEEVFQTPHFKGKIDEK